MSASALEKCASAELTDPPMVNSADGVWAPTPTMLITAPRRALRCGQAARADRIKSVADLKGKTVGVSAPGSATHLFLNILLAKAGLAPTDVSVIAVGNGSGAIAAMRTGQDLDAIST